MIKSNLTSVYLLIYPSRRHEKKNPKLKKQTTLTKRHGINNPRSAYQKKRITQAATNIQMNTNNNNHKNNTILKINEKC